MAQQPFRTLIEELYDPANAKTPGAKAGIVRELLSLADQARQDPDERYVLLDSAVQLAEESGDAALAARARERLGIEFDVEGVTSGAESPRSPVLPR